jgi:hypothetical protein
VKSRFDWGFEVGVGYLFCNDGWRADLDFIFHQGGGSNSFSNQWNQLVVPSTAYTTGIIAGSNVTSFVNAHASLDTDFYRLSLALSRGTFVSRLLTLTPGFALTATWLDVNQKNKFSDANHNTLTEKKESETWQIGPTATLDTRLCFGDSGFSLTGQWDMTLGFGKTDISQQTFYSTSAATYTAKEGNNVVRFAPSAHALLGIQYDRDYFDHTQHLTVLAGLDTYTMWAGNRTIRAVNTAPVQFEQKDGNAFSLVGLTVAINYQF